MNYENITTSLEWSKKLKESGWEQVEWFEAKDGQRLFRGNTFVYWTNTGKSWQQINGCNGIIEEDIASPTAEEILKKLPKRKVKCI